MAKSQVEPCTDSDNRNVRPPQKRSQVKVDLLSLIVPLDVKPDLFLAATQLNAKLFGLAILALR